MKLLIALVLLFTATIYSQETRTISITKNNQDGYNIVRDGKTIYKYNKENCDSSTISILDEIYLKSNTDSSVSTNVNVWNLPQENGFDWVPLILAVIAILGSFFSGFYANRWSSKSQTEHYKMQIRAENKRQWLEKVRTEGSQYFQLLADTESIKEELESHSNNQVKLSIEELDELIESLKSLQKEAARRQILFTMLFDENEHSDFLKLMDNLLTAISKMDISRQEKREDALVKLHKLINVEQTKLDEGKF